MSEKKKIVSIEDRIPKLKQARKKKANRRLIFYLSIFFVLISIIVYLQSPLSNIHRLEVEGNDFLPDDTIIQSSGLTTSDNMWRIDKDKVIKRIQKNEEVEKVSISRGFPATVTINVTELGRVGYLQLDGSYRALLTNGSISEKSGTSQNPMPRFFMVFRMMNIWMRWQRSLISCQIRSPGSFLRFTTSLPRTIHMSSSYS